MVNLAPDHYITSHDIKWPETTKFKPDDADWPEKEYPSVVLPKAEAYMNVKYTDTDKTFLLGTIYHDDRNDVTHRGIMDGWIKPAAKGWVVYLQPGHFAEEYKNPIIAQMVLNAVEWNPEEK